MTRSYRPAWTAGAASFPASSPGSSRQLSVEVPAGAGQVLIAPAGRRGQRAHGLEPAAGLHRDRGQHRVQPDPLLGGGGHPVGVELALPDLHQRGVHVVDAGAGQQPGAPVAEQRQLVRDAGRPAGPPRRPTPSSRRRSRAHRPARCVPCSSRRRPGRRPPPLPRRAPPRPWSGPPWPRSPRCRPARRARPGPGRPRRPGFPGAPSDSPICWPRMRSARKSACSAPSSRRPLQRGRGQLAQRVAGELRDRPAESAEYCAPRVATYPGPAAVRSRRLPHIANDQEAWRR